MIYLLLLPVVIILIVCLSILVKSFGVFLAVKTLRVGGNTYMRAVKIILWQVVYFLPALIVYWLLLSLHMPFRQILGFCMFVAWYFWTMHLLCKKYYATDLNKNILIAIVSFIYNMIFGVIFIMIVLVPVAVWISQHSTPSQDGSEKVLHMNKDFESSISGKVNFGSERSGKARKVIHLKELLHLQ